MPRYPILPQPRGLSGLVPGWTFGCGLGWSQNEILGNYVPKHFTLVTTNWFGWKIRPIPHPKSKFQSGVLQETYRICHAGKALCLAIRHVVDGFDSQWRIKHLDIIKTLGFIKQLVHDGNCLRDTHACFLGFWNLQRAKQTFMVVLRGRLHSL